MDRIVVVGASLTGLRAVEALRREGFGGHLTLVGAEPHLPYDRPPLSKELLTGEWDHDRVVLRKQPYDELEAIAFVGLIRGCRRYDPTRINPGTGRPYAISTLVCPFITGEILHHFRDRGHAIKFPSKWREKWGLVQKLMGDPMIGADQVAEQAGLTPDELTEMLGSMTGTSNLDDLHGADACDAISEPEIDRLGPLQGLVAQAWDNLHPADRGQLAQWWANPRRLAYPQGPIEQFHRRLKALLHGRRLSEMIQLGLGITVAPAAPQEASSRPAKATKRRRVKDPGQQPLAL